MSYGEIYFYGVLLWIVGTIARVAWRSRRGVPDHDKIRRLEAELRIRRGR